MPIRPAHLTDDERRRLGAWYTPPALVAHLVDLVMGPVLARAGSLGDLRVLDPACGDGAFLVEVARRAAERFGVSLEDAAACCHGVDVDPEAVGEARRRLGGRAHLHVGDAHGRALGGFDAVVGNPPFLSPLVAASGRRALGGAGATYADAAADFLVLAVRAARPDGGRVGLVVPQSLVAVRDAAWARRAVLDLGALEHVWWSPTSVFDASVRTAAVVLERSRLGGPVARSVGLPPVGARAVAPPAPDAPWSSLLADLAGVPDLPLLEVDGTLGAVAEVLAGGFRDQFYALAGVVADDAAGPALVTTGLLDPGGCAWGQRPTTVAGRTFASPRVDLEGLAGSPQVRAWADRRLVPKVLVATQTRVLEAAVDDAGAWLPAVPVLSVLPAPGGPGVWELGAVLTSPVASAWAATEAIGSGLSAASLRVTAPLLRRVPMPSGPLSAAAEALQAGDVASAGWLAATAYGVDDDGLLGWWLDGVARARRARVSGSRAPRGSKRRER